MLLFLFFFYIDISLSKLILQLITKDAKILYQIKK